LIVAAMAACMPEPSIERDVPYDPRFGSATTLDVFTPRTDTDGRPVVLIVHGGGWWTETKERFDHLAVRFAAEDLLAISINYRRVGEGGVFPNAVLDLQCALAWVHEHAARLGGDPERITLFGYSAGAQLAGLVGVASERPDLRPDCGRPGPVRPAAVIAGAGPMDLRRLGWASEVQDFLGGSAQEIPEVYARASPLENVGESEPPFLLLHGDQDLYVPAEHSERMHSALVDQGNEAQLVLLRGGGHVVNPGAGAGDLIWEEWAIDSPEAWLATLDFLSQMNER
jgi:acetyl esterase/lipase